MADPITADLPEAADLPETPPAAPRLPVAGDTVLLAGKDGTLFPAQVLAVHEPGNPASLLGLAVETPDGPQELAAVPFMPGRPFCWSWPPEEPDEAAPAS